MHEGAALLAGEHRRVQLLAPLLAARGQDHARTRTTQGLVDIIGTTLSQGASGGNVEVDALRARVKKLTDKHPLYAGL